MADLQVLSDGKLLVLGFDWNIWRFNADGSPDLTFGGGDGVIRPGIDAPVRTNTSTSAMVVQPDGKFVVAGTYSASGSPYYESVIVRFMADGTIDSTFHTASFGDSMAFDVALQSQGPSYCSGSAFSAHCYLVDANRLVRYTLDARDLEKRFHDWAQSRCPADFFPQYLLKWERPYCVSMPTNATFCTRVVTQ